VVSAYLLAQTAVTPLYGKLGDLYGRKVVLQSAVMLFLAGLGAVRRGPEHDRADCVSEQSRGSAAAA
jgi:MFS family permease